MADITKPIFWYNGSVYHQSPAVLDLRDRGILLGDGVFDTAPVIDGVVIDVAAHIDRLIAHAAVIGMVIDRDFLMPAVRALVPGHTGLLRLTVTRGVGHRGLAPPEPASPVLFAQLSPWDRSACFAPVRLWQTPIRRNETSPLSRIKSLNYLDAVLAHRDALAAGADEALFLNSAGHICCAGTGNIFVVMDDGVLTPPVADGVMNGTIRAWLLAQDFGVREQSLKPDIFAHAKSVFITNARRLLAPVRSIEDGAQKYVFEPTINIQIKDRLIQHMAAQTSIL